MYRVLSLKSNFYSHQQVKSGLWKVVIFSTQYTSVPIAECIAVGFVFLIENIIQTEMQPKVFYEFGLYIIADADIGCTIWAYASCPVRCIV